MHACVCETHRYCLMRKTKPKNADPGRTYVVVLSYSNRKGRRRHANATDVVKRPPPAVTIPQREKYLVPVVLVFFGFESTTVLV